MHYEFTKDYLTGIDQIDKEHAHLFEIANETWDLVHDELVTDKYDRIVDLLEELREYTKTHFAHEEEYMLSIGFPHYYSELHQHKTFIKKLEDINLKELDASQQEHIEDILDFLAKWLQGHIKGADRRIGASQGTLPQ